MGFERGLSGLWEVEGKMEFEKVEWSEGIVDRTGGIELVKVRGS